MTGACAIFISVFLAFSIASVCSDCTLYVSPNPPIIVKSFGSKTKTKKPQGMIQIKHGDEISAFCPTGFQRIGEHDLSDQYIKRVKIKCETRSAYYVNEEDSRRFIESPYEEEYHYPRELITFFSYFNNPTGCREGSTQMFYESQSALPGCGMNMSYAIGIAPTPSNQIITAGVCYDLDRLTLRYVNYVAQPRSSEIISNQINLEKVSLDKELSNVDTFFSFISQGTFREWLTLNKLKQPLLNAFDFDYTSLIRDAELNAELKDFDYIFNTIWWRNVRLGNWQFYLDALEERTKSVQYLVNMGTSGVIAIPESRCNSPTVIAIESHGITVKAPMYIWAHLRSLGGAANASAEEFVVIANNSPYNPISNSNTFCEDICDEIEWLQTSLFGSVRLMPKMGVVFCCRPEDVAAKLDNFPHQEQRLSTTMKAISPLELDDAQTVPTITGNHLLIDV